MSTISPGSHASGLHLRATMTTFAELGVPFPRFEAPTSEASEYVGRSSCRLCDVRDWPCPAYGVENGLDAHDRQDTACRSCGSTIPFPASLKKIKDIHICYECLRAGRGAITKSKEFG